MLLHALLPLLFMSNTEPPDVEHFVSGRPLWEVPEDGKPAWSGSISAGLTIIEGNTRDTTAAFLFDAQRRSENDRWTFNGYYNYGKTDTDPGTGTGLAENVKNAGAGVKYDYFVADNVYALANTSIQTDDPAELDSRTIVGAGLGWQVKEEEKLKWGLEGGVSHVTQIFDVNPDDSYVGARVASNLNYAISETSSFEQVAEYLPSLEDFDDGYLKLDNRLKMNITEKLIGQLSYVFEYTEPPGGERVDQRLVFTLGWSFGD